MVADADEDADGEENCRAIPSSSDGASGGYTGVGGNEDLEESGVSIETGESHGKSLEALLLTIPPASFVHVCGSEAKEGSASNTEKLFKCKTPQMRRNVAIGSIAVNLNIINKNQQ